MMYYWIFQYYKQSLDPKDMTLYDVTDVEVKAKTLSEAKKKADDLVTENGKYPWDRSVRLKMVVVADKK